MAEIDVRRAETADLAAITTLYNHYVRETSVTFDLEPFTPTDRALWFAQFANTGRHQIFVAEREKRILGYACSHPFRAKAAYDRTVETSVYLDVTATGSGLGWRLYTRLFEALGGSDAHLAVAGMTLPNPASEALHRRLGFERVGVFRQVGHKFGRAWDVEWWQLRLAREGNAV